MKRPSSEGLFIDITLLREGIDAARVSVFVRLGGCFDIRLALECQFVPVLFCTRCFSAVLLAAAVAGPGRRVNLEDCRRPEI